MHFKDGDLEFPIEDRLVKKLDYFIKMVTREKHKQDVVLLVHGKTGDGKTNTSCILGDYFKVATGRQVRLFFRVAPMIDFAKTTDNKIMIWDEPSLDSLSTDQLNTLNRDLLRLFNTMRKKRHILICNLTKFWKFPEWLVVDRALGTVHMHSKGGRDVGRFLYLRSKNMEALWNAYKKSGKRLYGKLKSFGGRMPEIMEREFPDGTHGFDKLGFSVDEFPNATLEQYNFCKDRAIESIGQEKQKNNVDKRALNGLRYLIARLDYKKLKTRQDLASGLKISQARLTEWQRIPLEDTNLLGKVGFDGFATSPIKNTMATSQEIVPELDEGESEAL
jgi:hypothetical protein